VRVNRYGQAGRETNGMQAGSVVTVEFEIEGQALVGLNGGTHFKFTEAFSLQVSCETQAEIDYVWSMLSEGGEASRCGWLKVKYGLSRQVVPAALPQMLIDALMQMKKFDIAALHCAHSGQA